MSKKIYIADDDANIRTLEKAFLEKNGYDTEAFSNGDALYEKFKESPADLIILDIMMPGTDGLTLCAKLREESAVPIIIVSAKGSDIERVAGITLGCDDYMAKPFSPIELVARVQAIFRRIDMITQKENLSNTIICGDLVIDKDRRDVSKDNIKIELTPTEFNILTYLIENKNRAVSREELLDKFWCVNSFDVDTRATDDTMKRLRKKLSDHKSIVVIETVRGFGFRIGQ